MLWRILLQEEGRSKCWALYTISKSGYTKIFADDSDEKLLETLFGQANCLSGPMSASKPSCDYARNAQMWAMFYDSV